jgi:SAM-dependent methyltransferase
MLFNELEKINSRPEPFQYYTAKELWNDEYTSKQMLKYHLDGTVDLSSRKTEFIDRSVDWMVSHFKVNKDTMIADFGCGPGLYSSRLARAGAQVTGIDFSENSIKYAREYDSQNELEIDYINEDYLEYDTEKKFNLIIMIMCDFCVLDPDQRKKLLVKFYDILEEAGAVLLDVYSLVGFDRREEVSSLEKNSLDQFWSPNDYYGFLNVFKYEEEKVVLDKHTIIEKERIKTIYNWLQYFSRKTLAREFGETGFKIEDFYSNVAGDPFDPVLSEFAIIARK